MTDQRGFTLLEVALAMGIIGITMIPVANMWLAVSRAAIVANELALATNLAQRTLETKIRNVPFDAQQSATGIDPETALQYTLTVTSEVIPGHSTPSLRRVEVQVSLPDSATPIVHLVTLTAKENAP